MTPRERPFISDQKVIEFYTNNIYNTVPHSKVYTYADDTTLVMAVTSLDTLKSKAQGELDRVNSFATIGSSDVGL